MQASFAGMTSAGRRATSRRYQGMLGRIVGAASRKGVSLLARIAGKDRVVATIRGINSGVRRLCASTHNLQMFAEWNVAPPPEWFDHYVDQFDAWHRTGNSLWVERGCFSLLAMRENARVLELCCGDGFNARHFYSLRAANVIACDFDRSAIAHAKKRNSGPNIEFRVADIRDQMPEGTFENIVWDAAIEHFTELEIDAILKSIRSRLTPEGILSGYTLVEREDQVKHLVHHEYEFKSKDDLLRFFTPFFRNVRVFETVYPTRHNLYFWASDSEIPFSERWGMQVVHSSGDEAR
ncbi:MAG: class I SAM-dependent methyltransferase [Planctomycetaceae bacterium]